MSKRKISKKQAQRIRKQQSDLLQDASVADTKQTLSGRVVSHHGTQVVIEYANESGTIEKRRCHLRANLENVVTGDLIRWQADGALGQENNGEESRSDHQGVLVSVESRRSELTRPDSYGNLRPVAANIDQIVIVIAPEPQAYGSLIDRYLVAAENMQTEVLLVVNKADLLDKDPQPELNKLMQIYSDIGYKIRFVSARSKADMEQIMDDLNNFTSIFVGQSGVGKSSLLQALLPHEKIRVGELSSAHKKGRHTTTHTHLYHFSSGGDCIDSPGIREFGLWHLDVDDIIQGFVDLRDAASRCKFRNCQHEKEPGCAIKSALSDGRLNQARFDSYKHILVTLDKVTIKSKKNR